MNCKASTLRTNDLKSSSIMDLTILPLAPATKIDKYVLITKNSDKTIKSIFASVFHEGKIILKNLYNLFRNPKSIFPLSIYF